MSINQCDRCGRDLVDPNAQYGWRCAKITGSSMSSNDQASEYLPFDLDYIGKQLEDAEKFISQIPYGIKANLGKLKSAIDTLQNELKTGLTKAGYAAFDVLLQIAIGLEAPLDRLTSNRNFQYNTKLKFDDFIYDQNSGNAAKLKVGAFGNGADNGCGAISVYNALKILGINIHPAYVVLSLETTGGALVGGLLGINPKAVENTFKELEFNVNNEYLPKNLDASFKDSHVGILAYVHDSGAHYVAIQYVDGKYNVYNDGYEKSKAREFDTLYDFIAEGNFLPISLVTIPSDVPQPKGSPTYTGLI